MTNNFRINNGDLAEHVGELSSQVDKTTAQLEQKAQQEDLELKRDKTTLIEPSDLSQATKEQMTGGSVAVVGKNTVLTENIVNKQVTIEKTDFMSGIKNLITSITDNYFYRTDLNANSVNTSYAVLEADVKGYTKIIVACVQNYAFLDVSNNIVAGAKGNLSPQKANYVLDVPNGAVAFKCDFHKANANKTSDITIDNAMICNGSSMPQQYIKRGQYLIKTATGEIKVKNLLTGYYVNKFLRFDTGSVQDSSQWYVTDFIDAHDLKNITFSHVKHYCFYTQDQVFVGGSGVELTDYPHDYEITIPSNVYYMRADMRVNPNGQVTTFEDWEIIGTTKKDVPANLIPRNSTPVLMPKTVDIKTAGYWYGKKIWWCGTSIPEGRCQPAYGYPNMIARMLGATVNNVSLGSSKIRSGVATNVKAGDTYGWTGKSYHSIKGFTQTKALKQSVIDNWETYQPIFSDAPATLTDIEKNLILGSSYEDKLDPCLTDENKQDLYVINFGWNDFDSDLLNNNQYLAENEYNTLWYRGAMNWVIRRILEKQPDAKILIISEIEGIEHKPLHVVQKYVADENAIEYYELWAKLGLSNKILTAPRSQDTNGQWVIGAKTGIVKDILVYDAVHPRGEFNKKIARVLGAYIDNCVRN